MIDVKELDKLYGNKTHALNRVSFRIEKKVTSIIGQNGAGKTTLLRILSTQLMPSSGTATINGHDVVEDAESVRSIAVSIPQEAKPIYWHTPLEHLRVYLSAREIPFDKAKIASERALKKVGLWEKRNEICDNLSGGMKRKMFVAMAIAAEAEVTFLDEPTTGLDPLSRVQIWTSIRGMKGQVILTTHYMEEAQALSDYVVLMDKGRVLSQGTVEDLLKPFDRMVRVESSDRKKGAYNVAGTWVSYIRKSMAEKFVMEGDVIKPITLDDIFIRKGVHLES